MDKKFYNKRLLRNPDTKFHIGDVDNFLGLVLHGLNRNPPFPFNATLSSQFDLIYRTARLSKKIISSHARRYFSIYVMGPVS